MAWKPPPEAAALPKRDDRDKPQHFWKPTNKRDVLLGKLLAIQPPQRFTQNLLIVAPVLLFPADGSQPSGFPWRIVKQNSWLAKLVDHSHVGKPLAFIYQGLKPTPAGNMRVFKVIPLTNEQMLGEFQKVGAEHLLAAQVTAAQIMQSLTGAGPGLEAPTDEFYDEEEDDALPF